MPVRRVSPAPPKMRAPRTVRPIPGQLGLFEEFDFHAAAEQQARRAVRASKRAVEDPHGYQNTANLRALSRAPIREELPPMRDFDSSRVAEAGYSSESHTLYVRFVDGTAWLYYNVTQREWRGFYRSASPGRYINRVLNNHAYGPGNF